MEGPEGSGKSTQLRLLTTFLREHGFNVVATREPGGTPIGDEIRGILHHVDNTAMSPITEVLLYAASRAQLVSEIIRPALVAGKLVICDRYIDSTFAYQGYGRGLDQDMLKALTSIATGDLWPDLTLLLDVEVSTGLARRLSEGEEMNRLDLEESAFHERVRRGYHRLAQSQPDRWEVVDAGREVDAIQADVRRIVSSRLRLNDDRL
ncbi:MAG TPA: dTMP kinase [Promineifilum sp.]